MPDLSDQATALEQLNLTVALTHRKPSLKPSGKCHWCDSSVDAGVQFCDSDCRDDYAKHQRMSARLEAI